jgi:hypothetical protein
MCCRVVLLTPNAQRTMIRYYVCVEEHAVRCQAVCPSFDEPRNRGLGNMICLVGGHDTITAVSSIKNPQYSLFLI